ncbi:MAG: secondary thiamine-phosphate synthase enzyme YjbQ [Candidatus Cloacimonadales bacterium]|nr:secondary thiamine-phosphate synthase enzyme YjbQ [Candidatus Cloacimonadales bacterium]
MFKKIEVRTTRREELIDVTKQIREIVQQSGIKNGMLVLFVPHTTAAVTINENADPTVPSDIINSLKKISPILPEFRHMEGNSDAHVKSSLVGCSQEIIIENGQLVLGTWQGIFFCEFDGPRHRKLYVKVCEC